MPFLARSSILPPWLSSKYFRKHGSLDYSCRPQSLHSQFWRASVHHALKALRLRHKYSSKSPNLMPAKFSRYTVVSWLSKITGMDTQKLDAVCKLLLLCFCSKMASEAISEHLIYKCPWGTCPQTPLVLHVCILMHACMHIRQPPCMHIRYPRNNPY